MERSLEEFNKLRISEELDYCFPEDPLSIELLQSEEGHFVGARKRRKII